VTIEIDPSSSFQELLEKCVKPEGRIKVLEILERNSKGIGLEVSETKSLITLLLVPRLESEATLLGLARKYNLEHKEYDPLARRFVRKANPHWWHVQMLRADSVFRGFCPNDGSALISRSNHYFCAKCQEKFGVTRAR